MATQDENAKAKAGQYRERRLKAFVEKMKNEFGDEPDLIKQSIADLVT